MWDFNTEFVVAVEDFENALALGDQTITMHEDTINVEDECHILGSSNFLARKILNLGSKNIAGRLDRWHARALRLAIWVMD